MVALEEGSRAGEEAINHPFWPLPPSATAQQHRKFMPDARGDIQAILGSRKFSKCILVILVWFLWAGIKKRQG